VRRALTCDPPTPGPRESLERVCGRLERDWEWVLSVCRVELCHGDLHLANAVWRTLPSQPDSRALLLDHAPYAMPWALEAAYCQAIYWGGWTRHPYYETPTHEMAALRAAQGLEVPAPADVDRLAMLCVAWQAMRLWPTTTRYHGWARYEAAVTRWIEQAAGA
jgi:Ser/Thr protein kinase RdoA (MazF antagonist)